MQLPNILTLSRIVMIPIFVALFYLPFRWANEASMAVFVLAAFTDWLDGYLARRMKLTSRFGAFLDPVADKLMVAAALVLIVDWNPTPFAGWLLAMPATVIIGREITIAALREWMAELGERARVKVSWLGKVKTTAQMTALPMLIYRDPVGPLDVGLIGFVLLYVAAVLTIWSMIQYLRAAWPLLMEGAAGD
ncbi:MAG TPA: CDP-diacylglycerol--glycerol-3-phosphate 3-phosphatidyltransferase [Thiotrichales bacterium]|nr:CDP-diacylglycerol--glycerol-3-phosphate 3-phosphatidyltransferase [Thiotrichales bacterium]